MNVEFFDEVLGLFDHAALVEPAQRTGHELATEEHVHEHRLTIREREILVDHLDAEAPRVARIGEHSVASIDRDVAGRRAMHARDHFHERRLAGAVVADQRDDFARIDLEAEVVDRDVAAEFLAQVREAEHGAMHGQAF